MRKKIFIIMMIFSTILICSCTKKADTKATDLNNNEIKEEDSKSKEIVDSDNTYGYETVYNKTSVDMNVYNTPLAELVEKADIIYKGKLANVEYGKEGGTDYTFEVTESLKGKAGKKQVINSIGGIMSLSEYKSMMEKSGESVSEIEDSENSYVFWTAYDKFMVVTPDTEYIIFATKHLSKGTYYFTHLYYGIYEKNDNDKYVRNSDEKDEYREITEEEIKKAIENDK